MAERQTRATAALDLTGLGRSVRRRKRYPPTHLGFAERRTAQDDLQGRARSRAIDEIQAILDRHIGAISRELPDLPVIDGDPAAFVAGYSRDADGSGSHTADRP